MNQKNNSGNSNENLFNFIREAGLQNIEKAEDISDVVNYLNNLT